MSSTNVKKFYNEIMVSNGKVDDYYYQGIAIGKQLELSNGRWVKVNDRLFSMPSTVIYIDRIIHNTPGYAHGDNRRTPIDMPWWMRWMICRKIRRAYVSQLRQAYLDKSAKRLSEIYD
jgi:hypothetical protein